MAKYFLGSVGKAEAFRMVDNKPELAFVSKTLTDSGLNISTTKDDIRAGQGAPIQFSFYHDPSVEITLTDVLWKKEYLEAQLGANFNSAKHVDYKTENVAFDADGKGRLMDTVLELPIPCGEKELFVWGSPAGEDKWTKIACELKTPTTGSKYYELVLADFANKSVCVRYLGHDSAAQVAEISAQIIPQELFLIITAPIFAGDACSASNGKEVGHITFEVPRFQLNGSQEFSMNMSSNQNMSLAGIALASESEDCNSMSGKLLRVIEVIYDRDWKDDINSLAADETYNKKGLVPHIYGIASDAHLMRIDNDELIFTPELKDGKWAKVTSDTEKQSVKLKGKETVKIDEVTITAA